MAQFPIARSYPIDLRAGNGIVVAKQGGTIIVSTDGQSGGSGDTGIVLVAAAAIPPGRFIAAYGSSQAVLATPAADSAPTGQAIGYLDDGAVFGATIRARKSGLVSVPGASWTAGDIIYLSDNAAPTNVKRTSGWSQQVGIAVSASAFDISLGIPYTLPSAGSLLISPTADFFSTLAQRAGLNASDASWFAGVDTVARPTVAQVMSELRSRSLNVRTYGASPSATAAVNTSAFAAAYADCPIGGTIIVPPGAYAGMMPFGAKMVIWQTDGATNAIGDPLSLPGQNRGIFQNRTLWSKQGSPSDPQPVLDLQNRGSDGGDPNHLMTTLSVYAATGADQTSGTWALVTHLDSYSTSQAIGNAGHEIVVHQWVRGGTPLWGGAYEVNDHAIEPTTPTQTLELAVNASGADPTNQRTTLFMPANKLPDSTPGVITEIGQGFYIGTNFEVIYNRIFYIPARAKEGMRFAGQIDGSAIHFAGTTGGPLIDASDETRSTRVLRANSNMLVSFVNSTKTEVATWTIDGRGVTTTTGETFTAGSALPTAAPFAWRRIRINGNDYMTPLYQVSQIPGA